MERAKRPWLSLIVLCLGTFAVLLDSTIVNVALPSVITDLHATLDQALWMVNAYLLVFAALLILASRLGDMFGPRRLFTAGLALFAVASALCGAAQSPGQLIAARALQGAGAAALTPQAMVIIQAVFPRERMGAAFGVFASMVGLAAVSGPTLGGVLTTYLSWRWVFYVNLPIAAAGIVLAYACVPEIRARRRHRLDLGGVLLATAGLAAVVYGVIEGQRYAWGEVAYGITIFEIIGAGLVILAGFVAWERRHPQPLVPLGLFRSRTFAIMVVLNVAVQFALQSMLLVNSINLQSVLGMTAVRAGLTSLPLTLALTALAPFAGRLTDRFGGKYVLMAGLAVYAAGIAGVVAVSSAHATSATFAPVLLVAGLGMGAIFAPLATMAMRAAPPALAGAASGVLNTGRQLGATLGGAIAGAVLATQLTAAMQQRALADAGALPPAARTAFVGGFSRVARSGLQVGRGQPAAGLPPGTPAPLAGQLRSLIHDVFAHGYLAAMRPALAIPVAVLLAGAAACLLLRRDPAGEGRRPAMAAWQEQPAPPARSPVSSRSATDETHRLRGVELRLLRHPDRLGGGPVGRAGPMGT
jgi:EmrB/QacA subfamily drug resistance transporter